MRPAGVSEITDHPPAGLALLNAIPSQGTYTPATGGWDIGALAVGGQATLHRRARWRRRARVRNDGDEDGPQT